MTSEICEDYISRKALKEKIQKDPAPLNETWEELYDYIIDAIDNANCVAPKPHWIPCSERLPEEDGLYLVIDLAIYFGEYSPFIFKREKTSPTNTLKWGDIVAWMPLPEPYKEDNNAERDA